MSGRQYGATIAKPIITDHVLPLMALLQEIGDDIVGNVHIPFARLDSAHFMSWFIVDADGIAPLLFLEINVDGPIDAFLHDLIAQGGSGIDQIYGHCSGYPPPGVAAPEAVLEYLVADNVGYDCFYICWRGLTVERIRQERILRGRLEDFFDQQGEAALATLPPTAIRALVQGFVNGDPTLEWAKTFPSRPPLVRYRSAVLASIGVFAGGVLLGILASGIEVWRDQGPRPVLIAVAALLATVAALVGWLLAHELTDPVANTQPDHSQVETVVNQENRVVQNHFASVVDVKPGLFRWLVLKTVLKLIHVLAAIYYNLGHLSGITSIHFARWVVIGGGRKLLFLSNYDGSWENYLDDFIDQASNGLTAVWSNTVGFPRSYLLVNGGARDELLFKTLVRKSQTPSLVWYSAYPDLSTQNIRANAAIREGIFGSMDAAAEAAWLKNF